MGGNDFTESEEDMLRRRLQETAQKLTNAEARIEAYEAGAEPGDVPEGVTLTPGQLWKKLLNAPEVERGMILGQAIRNTEDLRSCYAEDHLRRIENMTYERERVREALSAAVFGSPTADSFVELNAGVRALRNVMVDGIAAREPTVEYAVAESSVEQQLEGLTFPEERDVREKIGEQLKSAGIDTQSICRYSWEGEPTDACGAGVHECRLVNPLHAQAHECDPNHCLQTLTHEEAERIEMAK